MRKVLILGGGDGIGGLILAFQCAEFVKNHRGFDVTVGISAEQEQFYVLDWLFRDKFNIQYYPVLVSSGHQLLRDPSLLESIRKGFYEFYYVCPDLTFKNPYSFDYRRYRTNPKAIITTRLLTHKYKPNGKNIIYLALNSTTPGYTYQNIGELAVQLAKNIPNYEIYLPVLTNWNGKPIPPVIFSEKPNNLVIEYDQDVEHSLNKLKTAHYCICADNGFSHISYHLGQSRMLLDPHLFQNPNPLPWIVRWREDITDSICISTYINYSYFHF
jgi:hypothetical protein